MHSHIIYSTREHAQALLLCTPQTLDAISIAMWIKYLPLTPRPDSRLVWSTSSHKAHPQNLHINPHFQER